MRKLWLALGIEAVLIAVLLCLSPDLRHNALRLLPGSYVTRHDEVSQIANQPTARSKRGSEKRSPWEERSLEYFVWSELLSEAFTGDYRRIAVLETPSIRPEAQAPFSLPADFRDLVSSLASDAIASYLEKLDSPPIEFERRFQLPVDYRLAPRKRLDALLFRRDPRWDLFERSYPGAWGYYRLSPLGFNQDGTQAFGYYEYHCGDLCGRGRYFLAEKAQQGWKVKLIRLAWIS